MRTPRPAEYCDEAEGKMHRDAGSGINFANWRAWTARFSLGRAIFRGQVSDLDGKRVRAVKRAEAAEAIAQEANAMRMKVLLDAAREQAEVQSIESAERRFDEAKGVWEAANRPLQSPGDDGFGTHSPESADEEAVRDTSATRWYAPLLDAIRGPAGMTGGQIAFRSTAIAGLVFGGLYVYFDPDFAGDGLVSGQAETAETMRQSPASAPGDTSHRVDQSAPMSGSATMMAVGSKIEPVGMPKDAAISDSVPAVEDKSPVSVRETRATVLERVRASRLVSGPVPTPDRNPFYLPPAAAPVTAVPAVRPVLLNEFE